MLCQTPLVGGEEHICLKCLCELPRTGHNFLEENPATYLFGGKVPVYHAAAFLHYEKGGHVQQLIHSLKYHDSQRTAAQLVHDRNHRQDNREIGFRLGRMAGLRYQKAILSDRPDLLLPVPLHPKKRKQRGYNQSEWIARGLNTLLKLPIDTTSLRRTKETETQTHKQTYDRWLNMQNIFSVVDREVLAGKHILLIDDVITTGSTIGACAEALLTIPGVRVSVLAIAMA